MVILSQDCIERGNGDLQVKLGKWVNENGEQWSKGLKFVVHAINTSTTKATGKTPYELVFGQRPREDFFTLQTLADQNVLNEEDIGPTILEEATRVESLQDDGDTSTSHASSTTDEVSVPDDDPTDTQAAAQLLHLSSRIPVEPIEDEEMASLWESLEPSEPNDNDVLPPTVSVAQSPCSDSRSNQVIVAAQIHTPTKQLQNQQL